MSMVQIRERSGGTPMVEVARIFAKLECVNPTGSIKDRIAAYILDESILRGDLRPGMRIVEATSGNTGIALAAYGRKLGYPVTIVMPEHMTDERKALIAGYGAELILVSEQGSFQEAVTVRDELASSPDVFTTDQFAHPLNVECHERTTGQEILAALRGRRPDAFVAGVGTGGTLIGVGQALRAAFPEVRIVAVEPSESAVMTGGVSGSHGIYGIGDGFIPPIASDGAGGLHPMIDGVAVVSTHEAVEAAHELREEFDLCCGVSSGANLVAARRLAETFETVVTIFPDGYAKYGAQGLFKCRGGCAFESLCPLR
jgi:cysteine synthase A